MNQHATAAIVKSSAERITLVPTANKAGRTGVLEFHMANVTGFRNVPVSVALASSAAR
jgi:hypothetical protein